MKQPFAVLIFGPRGSGKTTQANLLADSLGVTIVDTGALLRSVLNNPKTENDPEIIREKEIMLSGGMSSEGFFTKHAGIQINHLVEKETNFVLGGTPRTLEQAESFIPPLIEAYGEDGLFSFLLDVPLKVSEERIKARTMCSSCGRPQLYIENSIAITHCRVCGSEVTRRDDGRDIETIRNRFKTYEEETVPVISYLKEKGVSVVSIPVAEWPAQVHTQLMAHLGLVGLPK